MNEEVSHDEKDQVQGGGPEVEVDERAVAERDRPHRPLLEARRPGRAGGREGRVAARRAGHRVQADAAGTDGAEVRRHLDRLLHAVQEEGLAPEARRRGPRRRDYRQDRAQRDLGRHGRGQHAAAQRIGRYQ